jgi:hypothetical protein
MAHFTRWNFAKLALAAVQEPLLFWPFYSWQIEMLRIGIICCLLLNQPSRKFGIIG